MAKKKAVDLFGDDDQIESQSEFEVLLNASSAPTQGLVPGDRFRGEVLAVSGQEAFISTGTPTDAMMPLAQNSNSEPPAVGDFVDVVVVRSNDSGILVKPFGARGGDMDADSLEEAFEMELAVEGLVLEAVKGGFRVKIQEQKAFCPISQMDWRVTQAEDYVGRKYKFLITKFERGRDLVVSRRKLLTEERAAVESEFLKTDQVGEIFSGQIFRLEKYGAFIRLDNGIEGLIPISELSWSRIGHPQEVVHLDQTVQVKLMRSEESEGRLKLSFSLKQGGSVVDPWATLENDFPMGKVCEGTVENKESFGLFINLGLGVTGLLPKSSWRDATDDVAYDSKRKGDKVLVKVNQIDLAARRLSLSVPGNEDDVQWRDHQKSMDSSTSGKFGSMADLFKGIKGS
ncbi:S1 RNA-binding domain-containing protein [bacterium]|nr:S1 RNA-binding domain-containing protein [bacterium]